MLYCDECEYKELCVELGYPLDCEDVDECSHYWNYLDGMEANDCADLDV